LAGLGSLVVGSLVVYAFASGGESNNIAVCNQSTQVNTVCTAQNTLTLSQSSEDWWHTDGTKILNSAGQQVYLRGVDDGRMVQTTPGTLVQPEFSNLSSWGLNFIRLGISWANLEPNAPTQSGSTLNHTWSDSYLASIDSVVQQAKAAHLRVVLDFHQVDWSPKFGGTGMPSWLFPKATSGGTAKCEFMSNTIESGSPESQQAGLITAEQMIASRYLSDSTVVGIDMFNEPQPCNSGGSTTYLPKGTTPYDDFYHNDGTALRQINPNLLLIYEDNAYQGYLKSGFALTRPLDVPNAIYSTHLYPDAWTAGNTGSTCEPSTKVTGLQDYQIHLARAAGWNQPLYIGEFDGFHLSESSCAAPATASQDTLAMMSQALADDVNWSLWEYKRTGAAIVDATGAAKQPLLSDLQSGLTPPPTGSASGPPTSGSVTLCQAGSGSFNSWNSIAVNATVPSVTGVTVKLATASGSCASPSSQSDFSAPITISDSGTAGATDPQALDGLNLANSKVLLIEVDLSTSDTSVSPTVNSVSLSDTSANSPPSVPAGLVGTPAYTSAAVNWTASTDDNDPQTALTYKVFRGGTFLSQTQAAATSYTDSGLTQGTTYSYTIESCDTQNSCSNPSSALAVTTQKDSSPPSVPSRLSGSAASSSVINLSWTASKDSVSTPAQLSYRIYRSSALVATTGPGLTKYSNTGLRKSTKYSYAVAACDIAGNCSAKSPAVSVTTKSH
jgi:hypothetical protein